MALLQLVGGIIYLLMGGDLLVRGAVALARRLRVPPTVVAFTVVAFGTSLPELVVGVRAARTNLPEIALGNVIGSNIANVLLVLGATALIYPIAITESSARRDSLMMVAACVLMAGLAVVGPLTHAAGLVLIVGLAMATATSARDMHRARDSDPTTPIDWVLGVPSTLAMIVLFLAVGLVGLPLGARLVIDSAVELAHALGVSNTVVGLTLVAVSTSLPELATTLAAAIQRRTELVLGTVIGSNLFNVLGIMGTSAVVSSQPIQVSERALTLDVPLMLLAAAVLTGLIWRHRPIGRGSGAVLLLAYGMYLVTFL